MQALLVEWFTLFNLAFLALDIYVAHSENAFRRWEEYIPLCFSLIAPPLLAAGIFRHKRWPGYIAGWLSIAVGLAGVLYHLESRFFYEHTLKSLTYSAPFVAPLAYTGIGLLLLMNRMVEAESDEWARWVLLLALGGFAGNFVLSLTDHAINGFFYRAEWIPVWSSALAVGFLLVPFCLNVSRRYRMVCLAVMACQALVGTAGFVLHALADFKGPTANLWQNFVNGAPAFAPLLFPNLAILAAIGLLTDSERRVPRHPAMVKPPPQADRFPLSGLDAH